MKRFVCFLLALVMMLGMIPMTAITANAASELSTSNDAIKKILTKPDRFQEKAQEGGYIGYGTKVAADKAAAQALYPNGISEDKALDVLKDYLKDTVDVAINNFTRTNNVDLTKQQHDALAVFIMEEGTGWMVSGNTLYEAVRTRKTGNSFLTAAVQQNDGIGTSEAFRAQMNRRLSMANLYLNGDYAYICPSNYTYTILAGASKTRIYGYDTNKPWTLSYKDSKSGDVFLGWYLKDDVNNKGVIEADAITKLDASTSRKILVSKFNGDNAKFSYEINANKLESLYVFADAYAESEYAANMSSAALKKLDKAGKKLAGSAKFTVVSEKVVDGIKWLYGSGKNGDGDKIKGWVYLGELPQAGTGTGKVVATATITGDVYIREGATANATIMDVLTAGQTVNIYDIKEEKTETGNQKWGKVNVNGVIGWFNLAYAEVKDVSNTNNAADGRTGEIVNAANVNVRKDAGTHNDKITTLKKGTKVKVLETKNVDNAQWGLVEWEGLKNGYTKGWIHMYYVNVKGLEQSQPGNTSTPETVKYTGIVTSNINLNVRKSADVYSTKVDELPNGTKVNVYETKTNRNMKWGRIGEDRWVCLAYLDLTEVQQPAGDASVGTTTTTSLQATISANTLSVYKNYSSNAEKVGTVKKGDVFTILERNTETTATGSRIWGRIAKDGVEGWINLAYVDLKNVTTVTGGNTSGNGSVTTNSNGAAGVVANCIAVNIRTAAGTRNTQITKLPNGTAVKVYERVTKDSAPWARITWNDNGTTREGWVCMHYVNMAAANTTPNANGNTVSGTNSNTISATGTVNSNINLKVRSGAGLSYPDFDSLPKGTRVTVYDQVTSDGMIWGRINTASGSGWICMSYVTVDNTSVTGKGVMGTIARCAVGVNVRSAPGTGNALVGNIGVGKRVEVFETRAHGNSMWARVAQGWICMDYVILDTELPPGTALDATQPTTEATEATTEETVAPTINKDNEVLYQITGKVLADPLNVRNDADEDSDKVGTVNKDQMLTILAIKTNGAELWGRIDQHATAGWVNMAFVDYSVEGYINTSDQPIYADPNTSSTVKGNVSINTKYTFKKLTVNGETVYGWYQDTAVAGWIPMGRVSKDPVAVIPTYKSSLDSNGRNISGTTNTNTTAYSAPNSTEAKFHMNSGVTVYINDIDKDSRTIWGEVKANGVTAWVNLSAITYTIDGTVNQEMNVRNAMNMDDENNIVGTVAAASTITLCEMSFDGNGNIWGKVTGKTGTDPVLSGNYILVQSFDGTTYVSNIITK